MKETCSHAIPDSFGWPRIWQDDTRIHDIYRSSTTNGHTIKHLLATYDYQPPTTTANNQDMNSKQATKPFYFNFTKLSRHFQTGAMGGPFSTNIPRLWWADKIPHFLLPHLLLSSAFTASSFPIDVLTSQPFIHTPVDERTTFRERFSRDRLPVLQRMVSPGRRTTFSTTQFTTYTFLPSLAASITAVDIRTRKRNRRPPYLI